MANLNKSLYNKAMSVAERHTIKVRPNVLYVSFWERKSDSADTPKEASVICRLTYKGKCKNYSTGIRCTRGDLDRATLTIKDNSVGTLAIQDLKGRLQGAFAEMRLTGRKIDFEAIWAVGHGLTLNIQTPSVAACFELFMRQEQQRLVTKEISKAVIEKIGAWHKNILEYVRVHYGQNAPLDCITPADGKRLLIYLKTTVGYGHNHASNTVQHFKRVLNYALENEWIERNPLMNYRRKLEQLMGDILTEEEMAMLEGFKLFAPALDHIRRAFMFQCYTGLNYSELLAATIDDVMVDDKTKCCYIKVYRTKTQKTSGLPQLIPLTEQAAQIMDSFKEHPLRLKKKMLVPIISNQKYNIYLKQLAGVVGLKTHLTSRVARRTAATYYLNKGAELLSVSAMLGHSNTNMTQKHYAKTLPSRVIEDFQGNNIKIRKAQ